MTPVDKLPILLVEDSEDDLFFFRRLIAKAGITAPVAIATDGQQALNYLGNAISGQSAEPVEVPKLIFLDLKLPLRSGFEVLQWARSQAALARTAIVVLSSSAEARDVAQAYKLGAQGYLVKYPQPPVFLEVVQRVAGLNDHGDLSGLTFPGIPRP